MTLREKLRSLLSPSRMLTYGVLLLVLGGAAALYFGPSAARAADCAALGGSIEREVFSPSAHGLEGTPGSIYSCVDDAGIELANYGLSGI